MMQENAFDDGASLQDMKQFHQNPRADLEFAPDFANQYLYGFGIIYECHFQYKLLYYITHYGLK